ncbi:MAG: hypothetical protein FWH27_18585 [Planctomycetaceae bacterium]|nr:hypothetical protein [Planctomycetaceae bacterium]
MKTSIITAAIILTGCFCAWSYIAAQPDGEEATPPATTSPMSSLLEIREPSQEDFEHCAKRAVDFFESWSEDQAKMDIAVHELHGARELPPQTLGMSRQLTQIKAGITYGHPELIAKKSLGENIILLGYRYHTDTWQLFCSYTFARDLDKNGEPQQWYCVNCIYNDTPERDYFQ